MKTEVDKIIISKVKELRLKTGASQHALAETIGTSHSFVVQVENEKSHCKYSAYHLYKIAMDFDCSVADLYPETNAIKA